MVFKTIISFISGLYRFYPVLPMGKTDCFTQFYPTGFTQWVKLPCQPWLRHCQFWTKFVERQWILYFIIQVTLIKIVNAHLTGQLR